MDVTKDVAAKRQKRAPHSGCPKERIPRSVLSLLALRRFRRALSQLLIGRPYPPLSLTVAYKSRSSRHLGQFVRLLRADRTFLSFAARSDSWRDIARSRSFVRDRVRLQIYEFLLSFSLQYKFYKYISSCVCFFSNNVFVDNLVDMFWESATDSCEVCQCARFFTNAFNIKNTPENTVNSQPGARRFLDMTSLQFLNPELGSPSIDKENNSLRNAASSQKFVAARKNRCPLEVCDPNSQDSGYGASYPEKEEKARPTFRFVEPLGVAPRRMSIESPSPMKSPVRCSPRRTSMVRSSLFRSVSSGYESMDDGFNDLIDVEALDDATQLPNGISNLICGDIVGLNTDLGPNNTLLDDASPFNVTSRNPTTPEFARTDCTKNFRRSLSLQNEKPESRKRSSLSKVRSCLFRSPNGRSPTVNSPSEDNRSKMMFRRQRFSGDCTIFDSPLSVRSFKRPDPPIDESPKLVKRSRRSCSSTFLDVVKKMDVDENIPSNSRPVSLQRSHSVTATTTVTTMDMGMEVEIMQTRSETNESDEHAHIKSAIHRSTTDTDLTGDFSKPCVLPLATGHHEDLKSISVETLAALIRGEFNDRIGSFQIVDCRYPYEFDAGHIQGALNLYSKDQIERILLDPLTNTPRIQPDSNKRNILVFHCEFSWERGPNLSRFLRNLDRQRNKEYYPALHYPEVYLLHGGYEQFFREQKPLCSPQGYRPMRHPDHEADLRQFRNKSKSWQGERSRITGSVTRTNLKRLGF